MTDRPDLVLIMTDQQRYDQVGFASAGHFETPNIDRLAAQGVVFEHAYSGSTTCVPARTSLLTGLLPHRAPTQVNGLALREGFWTVAHALRDAGYDTALVGKMHFNPIRAEHGFDTLRTCEHPDFGWANARPSDEDHYHDWLLAQGYPEWRGRRAEVPFPLGPSVHPTGWIERETIELLERRDGDRPLFLVVSFLHPHGPLNPPEPYASMYDPADAVLPRRGFETNELLPAEFRDAMEEPQGWLSPHRVSSEEELRGLLTLARALVRQIDDAVGRIIERLDLRRTVVFFTADHGDYAGHRGLLLKMPWIPFDDLARVPFVVAGDGIDGGRSIDLPVQSFDIALTCLDYAGTEHPADDFDSRSLGPLLAGAARPDDASRTVWCATGNYGWPMARRGAYKLVTRPHTGARALFDLEQDPGETASVLDDPEYRGVADELTRCLAEKLQEGIPNLPSYEAVSSG